MPLTRCAPACFCHRRAGSRGLDEGDQPISFNDQLYIYGGTSAQEDLEALSNESARWAEGCGALCRAFWPGCGAEWMVLHRSDQAYCLLVKHIVALYDP